MHDGVQDILKPEPERKFEILGLRLSDNELVNTYSEAVLEIEEAVKVLEQHDQDEVEKEQKSATTRLAGREEFQQQYRAAKSAFRLAQPRAKAGAKKGPIKPGTLPTSIPRSEAKKYIPPGCSIWRGAASATWQGHCKPFVRAYEPWATTSEPEAMRRVIKQLWEQYLLREGLEKDACPWKGLLD